MGSCSEHLEKKMGRREWLGRSAAGVLLGGLPTWIPASALGLAQRASPANRIVLGCIGMGIQGLHNMRTFRGNQDVQVVAVCDVHQTQRERAKQAIDEFYGNTDCAAYKDFRELLERKDIDAVQITTPDHWHPIIAVEAARRKKHIYCEKPIGWSFRAAQVVRKVVQETGVVFQFGTQQRSDRKFRFACELVRSGKIGQLKTILVGVPPSWTCPKQPTEPVPKELDYDLWLGPAPWAPYCYQRCRPWTEKEGWSIWYSILDYCMGMIGNWGVHHLDIAQWGNGTELSGPVEVQGKGVFPKDMLTNAATSWQVENRYANGVVLVHMDDHTAQKHPQQVAGYGHGVLFIGTEGWIHVDRQKLDAQPKSLLQVKLGPNDVHLLESRNHHGNFLDAIKAQAKPVAPIDVAVRSDALCWLQQIAILVERPLRYDPVAEAFVNDAEANRLLDRPMRPPWKLEAC